MDVIVGHVEPSEPADLAGIPGEYVGPRASTPSEPSKAVTDRSQMDTHIASMNPGEIRKAIRGGDLTVMAVLESELRGLNRPAVLALAGARGKPA